MVSNPVAPAQLRFQARMTTMTAIYFDEATMRFCSCSLQAAIDLSESPEASAAADASANGRVETFCSG